MLRWRNQYGMRPRRAEAQVRILRRNTFFSFYPLLYPLLAVIRRQIMKSGGILKNQLFSAWTTLLRTKLYT